MPPPDPWNSHVTVYDKSGIRAVHTNVDDCHLRRDGTVVVIDADGAQSLYHAGQWTSVSEHRGNPNARSQTCPTSQPSTAPRAGTTSSPPTPPSTSRTSTEELTA